MSMASMWRGTSGTGRTARMWRSVARRPTATHGRRRYARTRGSVTRSCPRSPPHTHQPAAPQPTTTHTTHPHPHTHTPPTTPTPPPPHPPTTTHTHTNTLTH